MSHESRELELFVENDAQLHRSQEVPIQKNLITKMAQGVYNHTLAVKLYGYLMANGAKKYVREFGGHGDTAQVFSTADRKEAAESFTKSFEVEAKLGNYDHLLPKKYAGWSGKQQNPTARIGTKLTKVRIKVGKRTVNGMAKRVGGRVKVFVTPGVAKGLPKRYRRANPVTKFKVGDKVVDKDGFKGTVTKVTFHDKSHWYDVRLPSGYAVRYDSDLTKVATR